MNNLRIIREKKKYTQLKVSVDLGVSQELISQYEMGKANPTVENLLKLAEYFNCSTDFLLDRTDIALPISEINTELESVDIVQKYKALSHDRKQALSHYLDYLSNPENRLDKNE